MKTSFTIELNGQKWNIASDGNRLYMNKDGPAPQGDCMVEWKHFENAWETEQILLMALQALEEKQS